MEGTVRGTNLPIDGEHHCSGSIETRWASVQFVQHWLQRAWGFKIHCLILEFPLSLKTDTTVSMQFSGEKFTKQGSFFS